MTCSFCKQEKPLTEFYPSQKYTCKTCVNSNSSRRRKITTITGQSLDIGSRHQRYRERALKKNVPFSLTVTEIRDIVVAGGECTYCGRSTVVLGIDRKVPAKGYVRDNMVISCNECNTMKGTWLSYDEMLVVGTTLRQLYAQRKTSYAMQ